MKLPNRKNILAALLAMVAITVTASAGFIFSPRGNGGREAVVAFREGSSLRRIATELQEKGILSSAGLFVLFGRATGSAAKVQAGTYLFNDGMPPREILRKLVTGDIYLRPFILPRGYSMYQVAELLERQGYLPAEKFLAACTDGRLLDEAGIEAGSAEGYLYPATYNIPEGKTATEVVREMTGRFAAECRPKFENEVRASGLGWTKVLTVASMIEKEAVVASEQPRISSVFHNRIKKRMRLQSDPTCIYGVRTFGGKVTRADVLRGSPYNTYRIDGLPPGPIGNPGEEAIRATLNPEQTDYLYFVARTDGTHFFSRTLEEHNRAVRTYLKAPVPKGN